MMKIKNIDEWSDQDIETEISRIQGVIKEWATSKDLWFDCGFKSYLEHVNGEPKSPPITTLFWSEGDFHRFITEGIEGLDTEFYELLEAHGYWFELYSSCTFAIYPNDEALSKKFEEYFHWQWVCSLVTEDTSDVYEELYSHFITNPDDLHKLEWRDFEILLFRIFQNHGFKAILGPGRGDEGIDIRLWQEDPLGDILTVVQAKKYAPHRSIGQTDVAALFGVSMVENAQKALFVTTSNYAPVAKRFAARTSGILELAEKEVILDWCGKATAGMIADKSSLLSEKSIETIIGRLSKQADHRIVHATWGYNMIHNNFAIVVKESKHAALLMGLTNQTLRDDRYGQRGEEIPILDPNLSKSLLHADNVWRAKRSEENGRISYWDGERLYSVWNGQPVNFDYMD